MTRRAFIGATAASLLLAACSSTETEKPVPVARPMHPVGFSLGSSALWADDADLVRIFDTVVKSGVDSVRIDVSWTFTEPFEGSFDWQPTDRLVEYATARGLTVLATITNTPAWAGAVDKHTARPLSAERYGKFAGLVADRYRGTISHYEIWNEPNGKLFFEPAPDPNIYAQMLIDAHREIKAADPAAVVVAGALGSTDTSDINIAPLEFLEAMYAAGAQGSFDILSYHPYDYLSPLANGTLYESSPMRQMIAMHAYMTSRGDGHKPIWITEYGFPTTDVDEQLAADLLTESLQQWQEVGFHGSFYVYTVRDGDTESSDPEDSFGVVRSDYSPKLALPALTALMSAGIPTRPDAEYFRSNEDPKLGAPVSPVYRIGEGLGQEFELGSRFVSRGEFTSSPAPVAAAARKLQCVPYGMFINGMQNLRSDGILRVFSRPDTGTHVVSGSILEAWDITLGFPVTDEYTDPDTARTGMDFEFGTILWSPGVPAEVRRK